jgi:hypothetical protein
MAAAAHNPRFAAKARVPQAVARDFNRADAAGDVGAARGDARAAAGVGPDPDAAIDARLLKQALTAQELRKRGQ